MGVQDRTGKIVGMEGDPFALADKIIQVVRTNIRPEPKTSTETCVIDGKTIFALHVEQGGTEKPYALHPDKRPEYYVRRGATTWEAKPEEIRSIVLASVP